GIEGRRGDVDLRGTEEVHALRAGAGGRQGEERRGEETLHSAAATSACVNGIGLYWNASYSSSWSVRCAWSIVIRCCAPDWASICASSVALTSPDCPGGTTFTLKSVGASSTIWLYEPRSTPPRVWPIVWFGAAPREEKTFTWFACRQVTGVAARQSPSSLIAWRRLST